MTMVPLEQRLKRSVDEISQSVQLYEKMEFERAYKYSVIFSQPEESSDLLKKINESPHVIKKTEGFEPFSDIPDKAIMHAVDGKAMLKFSFKYDAIDQNGDVRKIKYPLIVVLFPEYKLVEFRFDKISNIFKTNNEFYVRNIRHIQKWFKKYIDLTLQHIDLMQIVESIKAMDRVVVYSQYMNFKAGGEATLNVNENYVLPLLGELENLMVEYEDKFSNAPEIK